MNTEMKCRLCGSISDLKTSHVIPRFVWDWLKRTSVGGIRSGATPNRRVQDGAKAPMLCGTCEQMLSGYEKDFSEKIFNPIHGEPLPEALEYREWAIRFAVSVSWRVLTYHLMQSEPLRNFDAKQSEWVKSAELEWRKFLLSQVKHPGEYEQHLLITGLVEPDSTDGLSPYINRYLLRTNDMNILSSPRRAMTYAKLGRIIIFGILHEPAHEEWSGTKIRLRKGWVGSQRLRVPPGIYEYLNQQADRTKQLMDGISSPQADKIDALIKELPDKTVKSEAFKAFERDLDISGGKAFSPDR